MSQKPDNLNRPDSAQLTEFEKRLLGPLDDKSVLAEMQASIRKLVASDNRCETQIREILQNRFDAGELRSESVELVQQMLDQALPADAASVAADELSLVEYEATAVIAAVTGEHDEGGAAAEQPPASAAPVKSSDPRAYQPNAGPPQTGSVIGGRFLLQQQLPGGSIGTVYQAVDERLAGAGGAAGATVAIQILPDEISLNASAMRALQQEVAKGRCLAHPNIVRFIDLERDADLHFIVMEKLQGKSLATILEDAGNQKIDLTLSLSIVASVAGALDFAHERGVVHADVRPGNIMIAPSGEVKLFDFGMARVRQCEPQAALDRVKDVAGDEASAYSSMQVLTGEEPTVADDVFSLGCLLYRLVAGFRVFGPRDAAAAAAEGMDPQHPPELDNTRWQALKKSLAYSRIPRFATCAAFLAALEGRAEPEALPEEPEEPDETALVEIPPDETRRKPWWLAVAAVLVPTAIVLVLQAGLFGQSGQEDAVSVANAPEMAAATTAPEQDVAVLVAEPAGDPERSAVRVEAAADMSALLPPTLTVGLAAAGQYIQVTDLTLREDGEAATIDVVRMRNILQSYSVQFEEVEVENEDPVWGTGQYEISNAGVLTFAAGQSRARTTISMPSNQLREQDREVSIRIRDVDDEDSELALISVRLEDDDRRAYEASLPQNTIAFAVDEISVREVEPAVQIEVMRFQPDNNPATVAYVVRDGTAMAGQDYFPPSVTTVNFDRGQRAARILIPLVQDADSELVETFTLELVGNASQADLDTYQRIAVMIRDDD